MGDILHGIFKRRVAEVVSPVEDAPALLGAVTPGFDPGSHTLAEVLAYLAENPHDIGRVQAAEAVGKARKGIMAL